MLINQHDVIKREKTFTDQIKKLLFDRKILNKEKLVLH